MTSGWGRAFGVRVAAAAAGADCSCAVSAVSKAKGCPAPELPSHQRQRLNPICRRFCRCCSSQAEEALAAGSPEHAAARGRALLNLRLTEAEGGLLGRTLLTLVNNKARLVGCSGQSASRGRLPAHSWSLQHAAKVLHHPSLARLHMRLPAHLLVLLHCMPCAGWRDGATAAAQAVSS